MRLFFGLRPDAEHRALIASPLGSLRRQLPEVSWVPTDNLHLTMAFLGEVPESSLPVLKAAAARAASQAGAPVVLSYGGQMGTFPNWRQPRVFWLGVEASLPLQRLHRALGQELAGVGFAPDSRWHPHITLGRVKLPLAEGVLQSCRQLTWSVPPECCCQLVLFSSSLRPTGPLYQAISAFSLGDCENC
ncbi:MAG: RNA 2',3'-cyclic phosphodiesterase [Bacillota bacterium]|jgi:2'-5' RNA ligase